MDSSTRDKKTKDRAQGAKVTSPEAESNLETEVPERQGSGQGTVKDGLMMLIEMERNELLGMLKMRSMITDMCIQKKSTLILFNKMIGADTTPIEEIEIN